MLYQIYNKPEFSRCHRHFLRRIRPTLASGFLKLALLTTPFSGRLAAKSQAIVGFSPPPGAAGADRHYELLPGRRSASATQWRIADARAGTNVHLASFGERDRLSRQKIIATLSRNQRLLQSPEGWTERLDFIDTLGGPSTGKGLCPIEVYNGATRQRSSCSFALRYTVELLREATTQPVVEPHSALAHAVRPWRDA